MDLNRHSSRALLWAWQLFDWAAQPFFTLIATFVFPPFFVTSIVGDAVEGQVIWGWTSAAAALLVGIFAPLVGDYADKTGQLRKWFILFSGLGMVSASGLWLCQPGSTYALPLAILFVLLCTLGFEIATSLNNAMLPQIAEPQQARQLSWTGWAYGSASGIIILLLFIAFFAVGDNGKTMLGITPLIHFADASSGPARLTGPLTALWFFIFLLPLLALYRDGKGAHMKRPITMPTSRPASALPFLIANTILSDALLALFVFGGIYAAAVFGWESARLALLATALTLSGLLGVLVCIPLDRLFGTRAIANVCCIVIVAVGIFILGLDPSRLWIWPAQKIDALGLSTSELAFALASLMIGATSTALQAGLRAMFLPYATTQNAGRSFGFFALSGKSTAFIGPMLVSIAMAYFDSTKAGIALILVMIGIGALFLRTKPNTTSETA